MNTKSNLGQYVLGILVFVALGLGVVNLSKPSQVVERVVDQNGVVQNVGASPGPERTNPRECTNGVCRDFYSSAMASATTTVCSFRSPTNASSTLVLAQATFRVSTSSAYIVTWGKASASNNATTTALGRYAAAANLQGTLLATTTPLDAFDEDKTFSPGAYLNLGMETGVGGNPGTYSPTGTCKATFEEVI